MKLKIVIPVVVLVLAGVGYQFFLKKPPPPPVVEGQVYVLPKDFVLNLKDGRFVKLGVGLVVKEGDPALLPSGGHEATPPEGYGDMAQEGIVRSLITSVLTDKAAEDLTDEHHREEISKEIVKLIKKKTDVKIEEVFFPDLTVQ